jgi:hypothetical protein
LHDGSLAFANENFNTTANPRERTALNSQGMEGARHLSVNCGDQRPEPARRNGASSERTFNLSRAASKHTEFQPHDHKLEVVINTQRDLEKKHKSTTTGQKQTKRASSFRAASVVSTAIEANENPRARSRARAVSTSKAQESPEQKRVDAAPTIHLQQRRETTAKAVVKAAGNQSKGSKKRQATEEALEISNHKKVRMETEAAARRGEEEEAEKQSKEERKAARKKVKRQRKLEMLMKKKILEQELEQDSC